jgi:alpha-1,6-mannosyltransferase
MPCYSNVTLAALHAIADWMREKYGRFIWASACAVIVFRAEMAMLLGLMALGRIVQGRLGIVKLLKHAIPAAVTWLGNS